MPHAASGTHAEESKTTKPAWILITTEKEPIQSEIGKTFAAMRSRFEKKINFVKLDWNSPEGKQAANKTGLKNPPISVLISSDGTIKDKFEGTKSSKEISQKLNTLLHTNHKE